MQLRNRVKRGVCLGVLYSLVTYWVASISHINHLLGTELIFWGCPGVWVQMVTTPLLGMAHSIWLSREAIFLISLAVGGIVGGLIAYLTGRLRRTRSR